jgi:hypothetical protein
VHLSLLVAPTPCFDSYIADVLEIRVKYLKEIVQSVGTTSNEADVTSSNSPSSLVQKCKKKKIETHG